MEKSQAGGKAFIKIRKQYAEPSICSLQCGILSTRLCDFPLHQERDPMPAFLLPDKMSRSCVFPNYVAH